MNDLVSVIMVKSASYEYMDSIPFSGMNARSPIHCHGSMEVSGPLE